MTWIELGGAAFIAVIAYLWWQRRNRPARRLEERRPELVSADAAARRALCVGAVVQRGAFEQMVAAAPATLAQAERAKLIEAHRKLSDELNDWLKAEGLWDSLSIGERSMLGLRFGSWNEQQRKNSGWRVEALAVLLWALRRVENISPYDRESNLEALQLRLGMRQPAATFLRDSALRPKEEIAKARDRAESWLWRARTHYLQITPGAPQPPAGLGLTFEQIIAMSAEFAEKDGAFRAIDRDFPVFGKAYAKVTNEEWHQLTSIATERLYGLNWLCGFAEDWDSVPTET
jgi:hypothetical protein